MNLEESKRLGEISNWYMDNQLDFDRRLIGFRYQALKPFFQGPRGLELGPAEGCMTQLMIEDFEELTVVDASKELLDFIPDSQKLKKVKSLFEEFEPDRFYDSIIMEHILEHVLDPVELLKKVMRWLNPEPKGRLFIGVPNGHSIHRLAAVKMGLLKHPCELNSRDQALGHRRVYTPKTFKDHLEKAGLTIIHSGGVFFKPLSNKQIQDNWTEEMIQGFYKLGKDFSEHTAEIFSVCEA
jgi:2-polyprenyl-3-methyl-5-hydroxy-6-metoxy-1,4-benzoquinol methylase